MTLQRRAKRRDANEAEIVQVARKMGALMIPLDTPVDFLCGWHGVWVPVELKIPKGKYTNAQDIFIEACAENHLPVWTWRSVDDCINQLSNIA